VKKRSNAQDRKDSFIRRWAKKIKATNLLGGKCEKCGNDNVFVLAFHHTKDKEDIINSMINKHWDVALKEVKKCILLCANCHMEEHYPISNPNKEMLLKIKGQDSCSRCGYKGKSAVSLEFHHRDRKDKQLNIYRSYHSKRVFLKIPQKLLDEIKKCDVLCKNCHITEQIDVEKFKKLKDKIDFKVANYNGVQKLDIKKIIKLRKKKLNSVQIAKKLGYNSASVVFRLRKLEPNRVQENKEKWAKMRRDILALHKKGFKQIDIAKKLSCGQTSVSRCLIKNGIRDDHNLRRWGKLKLRSSN